jgi:hypothetical protein
MDRTEQINAVVDSVRQSIGDMDASQLFSLLIHLPDVIAQRAYDIQCTEGAGNRERADASLAKRVARDASNTAESYANAMDTEPGR